ncbi:hypothetical protein [Indiicoccus explosivorum]|uniref:hypothetical protein n=1 Tax=Indiicoccus explosivorum TaxID=1917864 RepID=UPI001185686A|nr:hypothetical protein [Indiicoccus explosivorum]
MHAQQPQYLYKFIRSVNVAHALIRLGHECVGAAESTQTPGYLTFKFKNTPEVEADLQKIFQNGGKNNVKQPKQRKSPRIQ